MEEDRHVMEYSQGRRKNDEDVQLSLLPRWSMPGLVPRQTAVEGWLRTQGVRASKLINRTSHLYCPSWSH